MLSLIDYAQSLSAYRLYTLLDQYDCLSTVFTNKGISLCPEAKLMTREMELDILQSYPSWTIRDRCEIIPSDINKIQSELYQIDKIINLTPDPDTLPRVGVYGNLHMYYAKRHFVKNYSLIDSIIISDVPRSSGLPDHLRTSPYYNVWEQIKDHPFEITVISPGYKYNTLMTPASVVFPSEWMVTGSDGEYDIHHIPDPMKIASIDLYSDPVNYTICTDGLYGRL